MLNSKNLVDADSINEINGNRQTANLFLCLLTPWFEPSTTNYGNSSENVLAREFEKLLNQKISPKSEIGLISAIGDYVKQAFWTNYAVQPSTADLNDFKDSWNKFSGEFYLNDSLKQQCSNELQVLIAHDSLKIERLLKAADLSNSMDLLLSERFKQTLIDEENNLASKIVKYIIGNETGTYQNNLVSYFEQRIADKIVRQLNETLNPINNFHYFVTYYWPMISNITDDNLENKIAYLDSFYRIQGTGAGRTLNIKRTINGIREYQICNLRGTPNSDPESIAQLSNVVLDRIYNEKNNQQLKFVFNSYKYNWRAVLKDSFKKRFTDISDAELDHKYRVECESYFYELSTPKSSLAASNLHRVRLSNDEYQVMKNSIGIK